MTCYYPNGMRFVPSWFFAVLVLGPAVWASFTSEGTAPKVMGVIFLGVLAALAWFTYRHISHPIVEIADNRVAVRGLLSSRRELNDLGHYQLVVSNDYVAFRPEGGKDVTIGRGDLSTQKWKELIQQLRDLPIAEYEGM